jgi:hypothetical protein
MLPLVESVVPLESLEPVFQQKELVEIEDESLVVFAMTESVVSDCIGAFYSFNGPFR